MKNGFKKGFFKLMNSAVYEKTMKDLDKIDLYLIKGKFVNMENIQIESTGSV